MPPVSPPVPLSQHTISQSLTLSGPQSRFGGTQFFEFDLLCPQNATAVLKGFKKLQQYYLVPAPTKEFRTTIVSQVTACSTTRILTASKYGSRAAIYLTSGTMQHASDKTPSGTNFRADFLLNFHQRGAPQRRRRPLGRFQDLPINTFARRLHSPRCRENQL